MAKKKAAKKKLKLTPEQIIEANNWDTMVEALPQLTEAQLEKLIELEMAGQNRSSWLLDRIHPRLSMVRRKRERREIERKTWEPST